MSILVYKLTTQDDKTRKGCFNECTWGPGVTHNGTGKGDLCGPGYIHAYLSPILAVMLNPIHAAIPDPKLWECSVDAIAKTDNDLKVGAVSLTTVRSVELPVVTTRHRVIFALLCAEKAQEIAEPFVSGNKQWQVTYRTKMAEFNVWKADYLAGRKTAYAANAAAYAAAYAAARAAPQSIRIDLVAIAERALTYKG